MSKLYFFRHAQASYLAKDYDQLSPKGEEQSVLLGQYLANKHVFFDKIYIGPLKRQLQTYSKVAAVFEAQNLSIPSPQILTGLKEHSGPEAVKLAYSDLVKKFPVIEDLTQEIKEDPSKMKRNSIMIFRYFMEVWAGGEIEVENIEPWLTFRQEVKLALAEILKNTDKGETIGVFTSGGTISSILAEALHLKEEKSIADINFSVRNTSFSTFLFANQNFNLLSFNEIPHLESEMVTFV